MSGYFWIALLLSGFFTSIAAVPDCPPGQGDASSSWCKMNQKKGYCDPSSPYRTSMLKYCPVTCGVCVEAPAKPFVVHVDPADCLAAHNEKRKMHKSPPLTWDSTLARESEDWAMKLVRLGALQHSPAKTYGENLYYGMRTGTTSFSCDDAVEAWYGEVQYYDYKNAVSTVPGEAIGHFTQVVWKSTSRLGVGIASIQKGRNIYTYIVARYTPPGNYIGIYQENVLSPTK